MKTIKNAKDLNLLTYTYLEKEKIFKVQNNSTVDDYYVLTSDFIKIVKYLKSNHLVFEVENNDILLLSS